MVDESVNELRDVVEVRFMQLEQQVTYIKHNLNLLIAALNNKMGVRMKSKNLNRDQNIEEK